MTRTEIIELIQNKYDRTPDHLPPNSGWDDGTREIADTICARITELEAELSAAKAEIEKYKGWNAELTHTHNTYVVMNARLEDALSTSIEQGKVLGNEVQVLREALEEIAQDRAANREPTTLALKARAALAQAD